jgi:heat shock protein HslJ
MSRLLFLFVFTSIALVACTSQQTQRTHSVNRQKSSEADALDIVGVVWKLVQIQERNDRAITIDDPEKYTLELLPNGKVRIRADCNRGFGSYTKKGSEISFHKTAYTRAACPPGSLFDEFTRNLHEANSYVVKDGNLYIAYDIDAGTMKFTK